MSNSILIADLDSEQPRGSLTAWLVCLSAGLFFFYEFFQLNIFDVINQPLRNDFHIDASQLSWMSSTFLWGDILFLIPAGFILDKFSTRKVIFSSMLICILGTVGFSLTHSFYWASFFHCISGIGNAFCFLACAVLVSRWFPPRRHAFVIGLLVTMAFLGGMMAHSPFAYLNERIGWRSSLIIDACVGMALLLWIMIFVKDKPQNSMLDTNKDEKKSDFRVLLANPQNWLAGLFTSFLNLPIMVLCALWGASYLQNVHHLSEMNASYVISLILIGSIIGCPVAGLISDWHGKRKPIMIAGAIASLLTLIPLFLNISLSQFALSTIFFSLGFFTSVQVISYPLIAESNHAHNTGAATSIASVIIMGGGGIGQVIFGWLMQSHAGTATHIYTVTDFQYAMCIFPLTTILACFAAFRLRETHCSR